MAKKARIASVSSLKPHLTRSLKEAKALRGKVAKSAELESLIGHLEALQSSALEQLPGGELGPQVRTPVGPAREVGPQEREEAVILRRAAPLVLHWRDGLSSSKTTSRADRRQLSRPCSRCSSARGRARARPILRASCRPPLAGTALRPGAGAGDLSGTRPSQTNPACPCGTRGCPTPGCCTSARRTKPIRPRSSGA